MTPFYLAWQLFYSPFFLLLNGPHHEEKCLLNEKDSDTLPGFAYGDSVFLHIKHCHRIGYLDPPRGVQWTTPHLYASRQGTRSCLCLISLIPEVIPGNTLSGR